MAFKEDWKAAKKKFEDATGKKKPTEKFVAAFRASSGLEKALAKVDELIKAENWEAAVVAQKDFTKIATAYIKVAKDATVKDPSYAPCTPHINALVNDLRDIGDAISAEIKKNEANMAVTPEDLIGKANFGAMCKGEAVSSAVDKFTQAEWFVNAATGQADPALTQMRSEFLRHRQTYLQTLNEVKGWRGKSFSPRSGLIRNLKQTLGDMLEAVGAMGMLGEIAKYTRHQAENIKKAGNPNEGKEFLKVAEKAAGPLNVEMTSLTKVELFLDNLKA